MHEAVSSVFTCATMTPQCLTSIKTSIFHGHFDIGVRVRSDTVLDVVNTQGETSGKVFAACPSARRYLAATFTVCLTASRKDAKQDFCGVCSDRGRVF